MTGLQGGERLQVLPHRRARRDNQARKTDRGCLFQR